MALIEKMTKDIQQKGGLIVSCQPVDNSPMDKPEIVAAMACRSECGRSRSAY